jgi:hypothetical protein
VTAYNLAVEVVLFHHNRVDALGILEGEETKTSGTASSGVAHDSALADLAEL